MRAREIGRSAFDPSDVSLRETDYDTSIGRERFFEFVTTDDRILGFLRLALPDGRGESPREIEGAALIREIHVYGAAVGLGEAAADRAQHRGLGTRLIEAAVTHAAEAGYERLAVISAIGTRGYYRGRGFADGVLYQHRDLESGEVVQAS